VSESHRKERHETVAHATLVYASTGYLENRPRYPDLLYDSILSYHKGSKETVLDLGCGPGLSLFPFAYHFKTLIGVDPSEGMIGEAQGAWQAWKNIQDNPQQLTADQARFELSSAEELSSIECGSIDLITAATVSRVGERALPCLRTADH
jgi:predicted TPR repeat methyltransferase